jgi:hypothetical protein
MLTGVDSVAGLPWGRGGSRLSRFLTGIFGTGAERSVGAAGGRGDGAGLLPGPMAGRFWAAITACLLHCLCLVLSSSEAGGGILSGCAKDVGYDSPAR